MEDDGRTELLLPAIALLIAAVSDAVAGRAAGLGVAGRWISATLVLTFIGVGLGVALGGLFFFFDPLAWCVESLFCGGMLAAVAGLVLTPIYDRIDRKPASQTGSDLIALVIVLALCSCLYFGFRNARFAPVPAIFEGAAATNRAPA